MSEIKGDRRFVSAPRPRHEKLPPPRCVVYSTEKEVGKRRHRTSIDSTEQRAKSRSAKHRQPQHASARKGEETDHHPKKTKKKQTPHSCPLGLQLLRDLGQQQVRSFAGRKRSCPRKKSSNPSSFSNLKKKKIRKSCLRRTLHNPDPLSKRKDRSSGGRRRTSMPVGCGSAPHTMNSGEHVSGIDQGKHKQRACFLP